MDKQQDQGLKQAIEQERVMLLVRAVTLHYRVNPATDATLQVARQQAFWAQRAQEFQRPKVRQMTGLEALAMRLSTFKYPRP